MGEVYDAFATIGRVDSYVTMACCCLVACVLVGCAVYLTTTDEKLAKNRGVVVAGVTSVALCMCLCGVIYVVAARKSKHVAALGGFMAFAQ